MRATNVSAALRTAYRLNKPMMIWGPPGVGKSTLVHDLGRELNVPVLDWRLTIMEPVDMRGSPMQVKRGKRNVTEWACPAELPEDGEGIIFLDELPQARTDVKNVAAMAVLERRIAEYRFPSGWRFIAAGNRSQDNAGTSPMPMHLNNRFWHIDFELSVDDWLAWAEASGVDYRPYAYIKYRPGALLDTDFAKSKEPSFASPRSWHLLSDLLKDLDSDGSMMTSIPPELRAEYFSGAVGKVRGTEFSGFLQVMHELVSIEDVYANPTGAPLPTDPATTYALTQALCINADRKTLVAALTYIKRLPGEFSMVAMYAIEKRNQALMKSAAYIELAKQHQGAL